AAARAARRAGERARRARGAGRARGTGAAGRLLRPARERRVGPTRRSLALDRRDVPRTASLRARRPGARTSAPLRLRAGWEAGPRVRAHPPEGAGEPRAQLDADERAALGR